VIAVREGHVHAAEALLKSGAHPDVRAGGFGWGETPLMLASRSGKVQLVSVLLRYGADHGAIPGEAEDYESFGRPAGCSDIRPCSKRRIVANCRSRRAN
jgi:hypothetical protein